MRKLSKRSYYRFIGYVLFILYIILLMNLLFFSDYYGRTTIKDPYQYNLTPFREIKRFIFNRRYMSLEQWMTNLFGNVLAFIPLGYLLPALHNHYRKILKVFFACLLVSLSVELLQRFYKVGIFDVDDLMLNSLGGVIGYILFKLNYLYYQKQVKNSG